MEARDTAPSRLEPLSGARPGLGAGGDALPNWPRLMSVDMAAQYMGVSATTFKSLGIVPLEIGRRVLWDRRSLDIYVDRMAGLPLSDDELAIAAADQERAMVKRLRDG